MKARGIALLVIGALSLAVGVVYMFTRSDRVWCGSSAMQPGDVCEITNDGKTNSLTYDEMRDQDNVLQWIFIGVGVAGLAIGPLVLRRVAKGKTDPLLRL